MNFELAGRIIKIFDEVKVNDRFKKQEFVIERSENNGNFEFTDFIKFQLTQDRTDQISPYKEGEDVKVSFNIRGNKWERDGKVNYFTNLDAWRIEKVGGGEGLKGSPPPVLDDIPPENEEFEDLPF